MDIFWWILGVIAALAAAALLIAYICFRMAFFVSKKQRTESAAMPLPPGEIYEPYHAQMRAWSEEVGAMAYEELTGTSFDGLKLRGKYYECTPGAVIELMFHGYRGTAERDLCGGVQRAFALGHNVLIVDQRASGKSEGKVISFGINESRDCLVWMEHTIDRFGPEVKLILTGISMGAATVMMASGRKLPENVIGVLADCGYTSPKEIICKVIKQMGLPEALAYPFVKLGARIFGGFNLENGSPLEAMKSCTVPVIFFHGEADDFVPCDMSRRNHEACAARKRLVSVPGAGHGLAFPADPEGYLSELKAFFE